MRRLMLWTTVVAAFAIAVWLYARPKPTARVTFTDPTTDTPLADLAPPVRLVETRRKAIRSAAFDLASHDQTLPVEISDYAGYAGLIVANGGLVPTEDSIFFKIGGFKVQLSVSEKENWADVAEGRLAAAPTTADSVTFWSAELENIVPLLIGYSRGADAVVTRQEINRFDQLKGTIVATAQSTEAEFLLRYLAKRSGLGVTGLKSPDETPDPNTLNLVFAEDGPAACDALLNELIFNRQRIWGCAAWEPKTSDVVRRSGGAAQFLTTNRNLLTIADVLIVNSGLASQHPKAVAQLVQGILEGNKIVRDNPENQLTTIARAFGWTRDKTRQELRRVQLANLPENLDFFTGTPTDVGSFAHIYDRTKEAYGPAILPRAVPIETLFDVTYLQDLEDNVTFADQRASIVRLRPLVPEASPQEAMPEAPVVPERSALQVTPTP